MTRQNRNNVHSAFTAWQTSLDAATTIAARTPILMSAALTGSPKAMREVQRMVSEKTAAAVQGALAAGHAWTTFWLSLASLNPSVSFHDHLAAITDAALAPARRTCRANARRLTRTKKRR